MAEILFVRHAQSFANVRDFTAFGNKDSELTEKGISQATALNATFKSEFGIAPETYSKRVAASSYTRPQQTARFAGFNNIDILPLIDESEVDREIMTGIDVINKHRAERWVPDETKQRASELHDRIKDGELDYEIYFTHGMFIAGLLLECDVRLIEVDYPFTEKRGYVPLQAAIVRVEM